MRSFSVSVILSLLIISAPVPGDGLDCSLVVDGKEGKSVMVTRVGQALEILVTGLGECGLTLLVVGGGGAGGGAGGGSGHLEYRSLQVTPGTLLTARVGRGGGTMKTRQQNPPASPSVARKSDSPAGPR